jgi:small subunit ribosomal protein S17
MVKKERIGVVVSDKAEKTIVVAVQKRYQHPKYQKILVRTKRYMAHDELNEGSPGDLVLLQESAPYSKRKSWKLIQILKKYNN